MTVQELIDKLSAFEPEMTVLVSGYEDGYHPVGSVVIRRVILDPQHGWYEGPYKDPRGDDKSGDIMLYLTRGDVR